MNNPPYLSERYLEKKALKLLSEFDEERLRKPKPIDVYAVIEKCLDVPYDWKYLTPDQSILGMTAFTDGLIWVWPESKYYEGLMPFKIEAETGTIFIDATLTEQNNRGRENFTVMHEVFHQVLHKKYFRDHPEITAHYSSSKAIEGVKSQKDACIARLEYQANVCAAAFLMPKDLIRERYKELFKEAGYYRYNHSFVENTVKEMAEEFSVSKQAMSIRLQKLKLIDINHENLLD